MITIPSTIKYNHDEHLNEMITKFLDIKVPANYKFIINAVQILNKDNADLYTVSRDKKVALCRKGLHPAISQHMERHNYFALKNRRGIIIATGKNLRRPEGILTIIRGRISRNPAKVSLLRVNRDLSVAEKCKLFGYELLKQNTPFN